MAKFQPTAMAKANPRKVIMKDGSYVGIGGMIMTNPKPPKIGKVFPEASAAQYKEYFDRTKGGAGLVFDSGDKSMEAAQKAMEAAQKEAAQPET